MTVKKEEKMNPEEISKSEKKAQELINKLNSAGDNKTFKVEKHSVSGLYYVVDEMNGDKAMLFVDGKDGDVSVFGNNAQNIKKTLEDGKKIEHTDKNDMELTPIQTEAMNRIGAMNISDDKKALYIYVVRTTDDFEAKFENFCEKNDKNKQNENTKQKNKAPYTPEQIIEMKGKMGGQQRTNGQEFSGV